MIVKFMPNQKGGSSKSIDYLLNNRTLAGTAKVIKGNEQLTRKIINSINRKQKVTVGVLSFEEENISKEEKFSIMESFEKMLLPNLEKDEYNILWVEHTDKGRLELNFVIPKTNLKTNKSIQPFYFKRDLKKVDAWKDLINKNFELSNPKSLEKTQNISISHKNPFYLPLKELDKEISMLIEKKRLKSRLELIEYIKSKGIEVTRVNKNFIAIKMEGMKRAVRLKGDVYKEGYFDNNQQNKKLEQKKPMSAEDRLIKGVVYHIYSKEKNEERRKELIKEFFIDMHKERLLQEKQIKEIFNDDEKRLGIFGALGGAGAFKSIAAAVKLFYQQKQLQQQKEKNRNKYYEKGL